MLAYSGLVYPNPESSMRSHLADENDNNNVWGFKSDRVDELLDESMIFVLTSSVGLR